jgi:acetoin utilization protein AcuB
MQTQRKVDAQPRWAVRDFMTASPWTIGPHKSIALARKMMQDHGVRHLPVLNGGQIVGIISERDIFLVESLPATNPTVVRVDEAMVEEVFIVAPDAPLEDVVRQMMARKLGSAVVAEGAHVVGVFTTIDALRVLDQQLRGG